MSETWVEVEGYPNYAVSNYGRVVNVRTDQLLSLRPNDRGYLRVRLSNPDHQLRDFYVHKLVGWAFWNFDLNDQTIHYDGDVQNNHATNLRLRKRVRKETNTRPLVGSETQEYKRQWGQKIRIVETDEVFSTVRDCADYINGDYSSIYACLRGVRKSHRGYSFEYH
ncbi:homing endonuclease [Arthrobacter phage Sporto]|nr:homing endonuclease [Arthrobacter phage Sporto]